MILNHDLFRIEFKENTVPVLVIENPQYYARFLTDLYNQCNGGEGNVGLYINFEDKSLSKLAMVVFDYFSLTLNSRTVQTKLFNELKANARDFEMQKSTFIQAGAGLMESILLKSAFNGVSYNADVDWQGIFKLFDVKVEEDYETLAEKISALIKVSAELLGLKLLVFVGLKSFLTPAELKEVYKLAFYLKINILLVEPFEKEPVEGEKCHIVDKDLCFIVK